MIKNLNTEARILLLFGLAVLGGFAFRFIVPYLPDLTLKPLEKNPKAALQCYLRVSWAYINQAEENGGTYENVMACVTPEDQAWFLENYDSFSSEWPGLVQGLSTTFPMEDQKKFFLALLLAVGAHRPESRIEELENHGDRVMFSVEDVTGDWLCAETQQIWVKKIGKKWVVEGFGGSRGALDECYGFPPFLRELFKIMDDMMQGKPMNLEQIVEKMQ